MNDPRGSLWRKWDLHFHTPKSPDYKDKALSADYIADALVRADVAVVAVTDHHVLDAAFIEKLRLAGAEKLTVLPGIELSSNLGGDEGVHFIGIFPEEADLNHLSAELMAKLDLSVMRQDGIAEERLYVDFQTAATVVQSLGGLITIHGHGKAANYETISSRLKFKQQQKTDLLRNYVDIIEVGSPVHVAPYQEKIFPAIGFSMPLIVCSDNHDAKTYSADTSCWIKADPTFAGLKMALRQPRFRISLGSRPKSLERLEGNKTRYLKSISFVRTPQMPAGEEWLQGDVPLNHGLVAIIGNKGSGKSALADCLGLLGSCTTSESFSFLKSDRFRAPKTGRAQHVQATLHWHDGPPRVRMLNEQVAADEPERVRFLPQNYVEKVCNELSSPGGGEFERELKKVIFSKVQTADRLGQRSLDDLVEFRTQELRSSADSLVLELGELAVQRANLEDKLDPAIRSSLEKRIEQRKEEIRSHEATKPIAVPAPSDDPAITPEMKAQLEKLQSLTAVRTETTTRIKTTETSVAAEQLRAATAKKLLDKLDNLRTEVARQTADIQADAAALGLDVAAIVTVKLDVLPVQKIRDEALAKRDDARELLNGPLPEGLRQKADLVDSEIKQIQASLDRPNREYQAYVGLLSAWQDTLDKLLGKSDEPESLKGMECDLVALETVSPQIEAIQTRQENVAKRIHAARVAEASVYTELYKPVQDFIEGHPLAKDHLKLEFKVELVEDAFADGLLGHLNQQRKGTFYGVDDGRIAVQTLTATVNWREWQEVQTFLRDITKRLHADLRSGCDSASVLLKNQIGKGKTPADLYTWLYGLKYLKPRYRLRWEGKDVAQLSPGERGTLLLIFYLLIDDSDIPLIIDQPEANLDNLTVAQKLVHCLRHACDRRQVVIVTHNPNLAVVCDADQLIHASLDKTAGNKVTYKTGALEHPELNRFAIDVLEGSRGPFDLRDEAYDVMGQ